MIQLRRVRWLGLVIGVAGVLAGAVGASHIWRDWRVRQLSQLGIEAFERGEDDLADRYWERADAMSKDDPVVAFNRGRLKARRKMSEQADSLFRRAAATSDDVLSANAHYNLGCLAAQHAQSSFGDDPETVSAEGRDEGVKWLELALTHWRDCLRRDRSHASARHNTELTLLWIERMDNLWAARDKGGGEMAVPRRDPLVLGAPTQHTSDVDVGGNRSGEPDVGWTHREAESVLLQAREREQRYRELRKMSSRTPSAVFVEKDW